MGDDGDGHVGPEHDARRVVPPCVERFVVRFHHGLLRAEGCGRARRDREGPLTLRGLRSGPDNRTLPTTTTVCWTVSRPSACGQEIGYVSARARFLGGWERALMEPDMPGCETGSCRHRRSRYGSDEEPGARPWNGRRGRDHIARQAVLEVGDRANDLRKPSGVVGQAVP